jgi:hypothetical protein
MCVVWVLSWPSRSAIVAMFTPCARRSIALVAERVRGDALPPSLDDNHDYVERLTTLNRTKQGKRGRSKCGINITVRGT